MYFDSRLWRLPRGARGRIAAAVAIGLLASAVGIARFVFLGWLLAQVFAAAPLSALVQPAVLTGGAGLLRSWLQHVRTNNANPTPSRIPAGLRRPPHHQGAALRPALVARPRHR